MAFNQLGISMSPEDVTNHGLSVGMRGYDKERVDRHLARVADAYGLALRRCAVQQDRLRALEDELNAAVGEARASAKAVAELMQAAPAAKTQQPQARKALDELEARLKRSESEREQALADLRQMSERASELGARLEALEAAQRSQPDRNRRPSRRSRLSQTTRPPGSWSPRPGPRRTCGQRHAPGRCGH